MMTVSTSDLRILIVADDPLARAGLATLVHSLPGYMVVGQMAAEADVLTGLEVYRPDVVVWDLGWDTLQAATSSPPLPAPEQAGRRTRLEHLTELRDTGYPVLALLADDRQATAAWTAGVHGLLLRDVPAERLAASLDAISQGLVVFDAGLAAALVLTRHLEPAPLVEPLTPRELAVLQLVAEGLPNKTIADRLRISEHTVKFHLNASMSKLGAQSRTEAVVRATRLGWLLL